MKEYASSTIRRVPTALLALLISITACRFGYAETRYVSPSGGHVAPFTSWETAATDIQSAVDAAAVGDSVLVTNGTYLLSSEIEVTNGITLESVNGAEFTVVDGNDSNRCFSLSHSNAVVDGFTITRGPQYSWYDSPHGAGVFCVGGTVMNCSITGNNGYGVYCAQGGTVMKCSITGNSTRGVFCEQDGTVLNCSITGNGNGDVGGGGVYCGRGGTVLNCIIADNVAVYAHGGGVYCGDRGSVLNCTIIGNFATGDGDGVYCESGGSVQNCIIYDNEDENYFTVGTEWSFTSCCTTPAIPGEGNIIDDPQFVDAAASDFRLSATSPCIDAGNNEAWMEGATDLDGNPRIIGAAVDIGVYEWPYVVSFVDIKANGADDLVVLGRGELLTVTANLVADPTIVGDTWVLAMTSQAYPFSFFSFNLNRNSWIPWLFTHYSPSEQGAIPYLQSEVLLQSSNLPGGFYTFYLGYDPVQNRWIDFDVLEIDAVSVIIGN